MLFNLNALKIQYEETIAAILENDKIHGNKRKRNFAND